MDGSRHSTLLLIGCVPAIVCEQHASVCVFSIWCHSFLSQRLLKWCPWKSLSDNKVPPLHPQPCPHHRLWCFVAPAFKNIKKERKKDHIALVYMKMLFVCWHKNDSIEAFSAQVVCRYILLTNSLGRTKAAKVVVVVGGGWTCRPLVQSMGAFFQLFKRIKSVSFSARHWCQCVSKALQGHLRGQWQRWPLWLKRRSAEKEGGSGD